jgi:hypothetical protein
MESVVTEAILLELDYIISKEIDSNITYNSMIDY